MLLSRELAVCALLAIARPVAAVWPIPQNMTTGNTSLLITDKIAVTYNGAAVRWVPSSSSLSSSSSPCPVADVSLPSVCPQCTHPNAFWQKQLSYSSGFEPTSVNSSEQLVQGGVSRALDSIFKTGLLPWKLHARNSLGSFEPIVDGTPALSCLNITQTDGAADDEAYSLTVSAAGTAALTAASAIGVLRGLETFSQLFYQHTSGRAWYTPYAPVAIRDAPRYGHRGVLLDVARNWFDAAHIYRTLDAMAWNKMNRLHLHMTDSQSWPLELPTMPEVASAGAYRRDLVYSAADLQSMQEYAVARGIELIVEIDMPGHIGSLAWSHPELIVAYDAFPYFWWCAEPPCGAFKLNDSAVDDFLDRLMDDLLPRVAPYTSYFHTGGDELNANDSRLDPGVGTNATEVLAPLLQRFVDANHARVRARNLTPLVWEELPLDWNVTLGKDVIVQSWLGAASVQALTAAGLQVIDSDYNFWYLDCGRGQWVNWDNGAAYASGYPFSDWCGPSKSWRLVYSHDPADGLNATAAALVRGGEVALWSETVDGATLDGLLWPRGSAAAEVLWSGNKDPATGENRSQLTVAPRLNEFREVMLARGVQAANVQMIWCTQADNSTECSQPTGPGY